MAIIPKLENYLIELNNALGAISVGEKSEIITEVKIHAEESLEEGKKNIDEILKELGSPKEVARRYITEKGLQSPYLQPRDNSKFSIIVKWISICLISFILIIVFGIGFFVWRFTPLVKISNEGVELLNGTISIKDNEQLNTNMQHYQNKTNSQPNDKNSEKLQQLNDNNTTNNNQEDQTAAAQNTINEEQQDQNQEATNNQKNNLSIENQETPPNESNTSSASVNGAADNTINTTPTSNELGAKSLDNVNIENYTANGSLQINNSTITNKLSVAGNVTGLNATLRDAAINGNAVFQNSTINGDLNIQGNVEFTNSNLAGNINVSGMLNASNTTFNDTITASTALLSFSNSNINNIIVKKPTNNEQQVIKVLGDSVINGNITFESGSGIVEVAPSAKVLGEVQGGIIKKN